MAAASTPRTSLEMEHAEPEPAPTTSSPHSLSKAVHGRRAEYTRPQKIRIKIGTWNVAACPGTEKDLGGWFVDGKGIDKRLAGVKIADGITKDKSQDNVESVGAQEERWTKKVTSIPKDDEGTIMGGEEIGIFVLGLQEVVDLNSAKEYIGRVYTDPEPMAKWRKAMTDGLPPGYVLVTEQQLSGMLLFIFASPTIAPTISSVSTVSVGTGIMGYLGNKGAVASRIVLGETTRMVFVNSHLASGSDPAHLDRRCWDVTQILQRAKFDPISWSGVLDDKQESIGDEDFAFWFGDLNFRLDGLPGDDIRRLLMLHTKGEYDIGQKSRNKIDLELGGNGPIVIKSVDSDSDTDEDDILPKTKSTTTLDDSSSHNLPDPDDFVQDPSQDPASLQATLDSLLAHDQLRQVRKKRKAFHDGWREGPITFLPTYKYDVGSMGMFDSSEKRRAPSWCDRILYRTRKDKLEYDGRSQEEERARLKDDEMKARGIDHAADDEDVLFDYNPDEDGVEEPASSDYDEYDEGEDGTEAVVTKEGYLDRIQQDVYTSHQRVLSSDHKPLDSVFTLEYDAVVPELKVKVQQEVARELDRAENEGRPGITIVVDHSADDALKPDEDSSRRPSATAVEGVDFGEVAYEQRKVRNVTIANTSQVPATFSFVDRPGESEEDDRIAPSWLSVSVDGTATNEADPPLKSQKREVTLQPGDAVNASLELFIDDIAFVKSLNKGLQLDDVLVLRVTDGRDHFIPIRGTWLQSCFARSVDELIRIPEGGVRALRPPRKGGAPINRGQEVCWSAPRELFKLTEAIEALTDRVIADANMLDDAQPPADFPGCPFEKNSWSVKDKIIRESRRGPVLNALDSDSTLLDAIPPEIPAFEKLEIMSEILIMFLHSLTDGLVPEPLWSQLEHELSTRGTKTLTDHEEIKSWVLDILSTSPNHNISFVFLTSILCRVAGELSPVPKHSWKESVAGTARSSMDTVRRSLSWKGKAPVMVPDPAVVRREKVERAYADAFKDVVFRGQTGLRDKERRVGEERKRDVLEAFLRGGRT